MNSVHSRYSFVFFHLWFGEELRDIEFLTGKSMFQIMYLTELIAKHLQIIIPTKYHYFVAPRYIYIFPSPCGISRLTTGLDPGFGPEFPRSVNNGTHERHSFIKSGFDQFELVWINFSNKYNISWWHSLLPEVTFVLIPLQIWKVNGLVSISPSFIKGFASNKVHWNPFVYFILW